MATSEQTRGRTRPDDDDLSSEDENAQTSTFSQNAEGRYRSRVDEYAMKAEWPQEPLYDIGEVVYLAIAGQQQPAGPYVVVSCDYEYGTYVIKRQDNDEKHPSPVLESDLRVLQ